MIVAGIYSHNNGQAVIEDQYPNELGEIYRVIAAVDAHRHRNRERTLEGRPFDSLAGLNRAFKEQFQTLGWEPIKIACDYPTEYYPPAYTPPVETGARTHHPYREMDFVKNRVGVEVQLGKYAFMVYNVSAKMTIFHNLGYIDAGVEIVPIKELASEMSSGVSYFEQLVWDLAQRGTADIDIPVLVLGIAPESSR